MPSLVTMFVGLAICGLVWLCVFAGDVFFTAAELHRVYRSSSTSGVASFIFGEYCRNRAAASMYAIDEIDRNFDAYPGYVLCAVRNALL